MQSQDTPAHAERFWEKVDVRGPDECWPWLAAVNRYGYGKFQLRGHDRKAHRVAYELVVGFIPDGLTIDHLDAANTSIRPSGSRRCKACTRDDAARYRAARA